MRDDVGDVQGRFVRVVDEPEDKSHPLHRDGIFCQRPVLGAKGRGLNALIDDGHDVVDDRG